MGASERLRQSRAAAAAGLPLEPSRLWYPRGDWLAAAAERLPLTWMYPHRSCTRGHWSPLEQAVRLAIETEWQADGYAVTGYRVHGEWTADPDEAWHWATGEVPAF